ncbi:MAG: xanthine dehydrogenase family protein molybdopterin-binding subunit [Pigmentiphaga sp.]|uniref:xanthine dehydrogenase family protein molybdopterin-binding subunit n=1 Tax=Pigmentiphaga sp. TaxID=1977564 RepID=UPI0029AA3566|nr:xanthine dehydrogenase family protein molybdopterin-binding subunit [Pigmentiphaga sp.]MDX3907632.1 xanthine dehydrogenase family protein molybdopterin-binding subunit [Pigmentiphaga sp.]
MIGQPIPRLEDRRLVLGRGCYTDDLNEPGQAYAVFLRSPHAHARILAIDTGAAKGAPGVLAVLTAADYLEAGCKPIRHAANPPDANDVSQPWFRNTVDGFLFQNPQLPLAHDKVRHVGEAVVMVVAESAAQARDAAEMVQVDYEVLDAVVQADAAARDGAPQLWDDAPNNIAFREQCGDREAARAMLARADLRVSREFRISRVVNCQMEPRAALGLYDAAHGRYTLISGSQGVIRLRLTLAEALGAAPDRVRVVCPDVGGGFGARTAIYIEQVAVVWAARVIGRPVKWTGDRSEAFVSDYQGRDQVIRATMGLSRDGRVLALDYEWLGNLGAHTVAFVSMGNGSRVVSSVYDIPASSVLVTAVLTNTVPTAPYRGAGRPEAMHVIERMLDIAARELSIDRIEIRRRNLVKPGQLPYRNPMGLTYDSGDFEGNMDRAVALSEWDGFEARRREARARGRLRGIGAANYIESPVGAARERVEITVLPAGIIDLVSGTQSQGQGHATTFAQVLASQLGIPLDSVRLRTGDTEFVTAGGGTHSDRSMRLVGTLLVEAAVQLIETGRQAARELLAAEQLSFEHGAYATPDGTRRATLFEVATHIAAAGLPADRSIRTLAAAADFTGRIPAYPTGAAVCELEIDPETGEVELLNYTSVDDVGRPVNPLVVEGQVHGGLAQGIGQALSEAYYVDQESGQVLSGSYMDYGVPRAGAVPPLRIEMTESPTRGNPLGIKGGGESGITPATAAIFNALADALRDVTAEEIPMPATSAVLWEILNPAACDPSRPIAQPPYR